MFRVTLNNASDYRTNGLYRTYNPNPNPNNNNSNNNNNYNYYYYYHYYNRR